MYVHTTAVRRNFRLVDPLRLLETENGKRIRKEESKNGVGKRRINYTTGGE